MDSQNSLYGDPFNLDSAQQDQASGSFSLQPPTSGGSGAQSTPVPKSSSFSALGSNSATQPLLANLSPSPSTPAQQLFNPDDFFASPPHQPGAPLVQSSDRFTPELKRRLFGPVDPLQSAPSTITRKKIGLGISTGTPASLGGVTPIPHTSFANPLSSNGTEECNSLSISPVLSPTRNLLPEVIAAAVQNVDPSRVDFGKSQPASNTLQLPGTPFTPVTTQKAKCSCKASRCLKLYCPCFANSGFCGPECTCKNCQNTKETSRAVREARETVLARDPRAFEPKVRNSPATASGADIHTKGCNCRKGCGKNYCVCRELRVDCGPRCTCSGPNGCLNGKMDALEDHQFKGKAQDILGGPKTRSPLRIRGGFPPTRLKKSAGPRQEKKRQKRTMQHLPTNVAGTEHASSSIFSPGFPALGIEFSPGLEIKDKLEIFKTPGEGDGDFSTAFSVQKDRQVLTFKEAGQGRAFAVRPSNGEVVKGPDDLVLTNIGASSSKQPPSKCEEDTKLKPLELSNEEVLRLKRKITEFDQRVNGIKVDTTKDGRDGKRARISGQPTKRSRVKHEEGEPLPLHKTGESITPENKLKLPDIESASSPATDAKDPSSSTGWGQLRGSLLGKNDKIEICRLPRILRVKMGSGRLLRKFDV